MREIHKIIVPVDFLQHTDPLVNYALYVAKRFESALRFIHVVDNPHSYAEYSYPSVGVFEIELMEYAEANMKQLVEKHRTSSLDCQGKVFRGNVVENIISFARDEEGDLIIIGTHGRKGLEKMWLGSVAERVVRRAPCPTLTCNPYK
jgi:nucleotide-binding universal stress UspA family protein